MNVLSRPRGRATATKGVASFGQPKFGSVCGIVSVVIVLLESAEIEDDLTEAPCGRSENANALHAKRRY